MSIHVYVSIHVCVSIHVRVSHMHMSIHVCVSIHVRVWKQTSLYFCGFMHNRYLLPNVCCT